MVTKLIIPDSHAHPDFNNKRFELLGHLMKDLRPDIVIDLGDSADMVSLCSYEKGTRSFEGRRYKKDIDAYLDAQDKMWHPVKTILNRTWQPKKYRLIGNHEQRIEKIGYYAPELTDVVSLKDLDDEKRYDVIVPYSGSTPGHIIIEGVTYAHYFTFNKKGFAPGGVHVSNTLGTKYHASCTMGHDHRFDYKRINHPASGKHIHALVAGVYVDYDMPYAGLTQTDWARGVVIKHNCSRGSYDLEWVSLERLKQTYG